MTREKEYFEIKIEELQSLGKWAADCAERSLMIFESIENGDSRPRNAIDGIREFSSNGKRTNHKMPAHKPGTTRIEQLFYELDSGIRNKSKGGFQIIHRESFQ